MKNYKAECVKSLKDITRLILKYCLKIFLYVCSSVIIIYLMRIAIRVTYRWLDLAEEYDPALVTLFTITTIVFQFIAFKYIFLRQKTVGAALLIYIAVGLALTVCMFIGMAVFL